MVTIRKLNDKEWQRAEALARKFGIGIERVERSLAFGAYEGDGTLAGVCLGRLGASAVLEFFYVNGRFRGRGVARRMVDTFVHAASAMKCSQVVVEYINGVGASPYPLLEALGFSGLRQCETLISIRLEELLSSEWAAPPVEDTARMFRQVSTLSRDAFVGYRKALERSVPSYANLSAVRGELLEELSWFWMDGEGTVRSSLLFADYDGELYLHSLYCAKGWERGLPALIHLALAGACAQTDRYDRLYVTCINRQSYRLAMRIGKNLLFTQRTSWRMYRDCR